MVQFARRRTDSSDQKSPARQFLNLFILKGKFMAPFDFKTLSFRECMERKLLIYMLLLWRRLHFSLSGGFDQPTLVISLSACCVCVLQSSHCNFTRKLCKTTAASFCLWCLGHSFSFAVTMRKIDANVVEALQSRGLSRRKISSKLQTKCSANKAKGWRNPYYEDECLNHSLAVVGTLTNSNVAWAD